MSESEYPTQPFRDGREAVELNLVGQVELLAYFMEMMTLSFHQKKKISKIHPEMGSQFKFKGTEAENFENLCYAICIT